MDFHFEDFFEDDYPVTFEEDFEVDFERNCYENYNFENAKWRKQ